MLTAHAIAFFGSKYLLQRALRVSAEAVELWGRHPPCVRQYQIEVLTGGALTAAAKCMREK